MKKEKLLAAAGSLTIIFIIWALILVAGLGFAGSPESYDSMLTGKGDPNQDVKAVQNAVNQGGTILLKGTFDFGTDGRANIKKDVKIFGEIDKQGAPLTKIKGGFWTFYSPLPAQLPPQVPGPKIGIQAIHFEGAQWAPIFLPYCGGANIVNNKITKVRPKASKVPIFGKSGMYRQQGIVFVPLYALPKESRKYQPGAVTGAITVADNDIDLSNDIPEKTMAQGVMIVWATGANTQILRNRVVNCSRNSIESLDNYPGKDGSGMTLFKDNIIVTADKEIPLPTPSTPNGIIAGWFLDLTGASDPARRTKIIITDNQIETRGDTSMGILVISDGAVIASNHILLKGGEKARAIVQLTSDAKIVNNKIEGSGLCAAMLTPFKGLKGDRNTLIGNDFTLFKASAANVLLQSSNNVLIGKCGKVIDKGQGNQILD